MSVESCQEHTIKDGYIVGLTLKPELEMIWKLHRDAGKLWGEKGTRDDWRNVTRHCIKELAAVTVMAEWLCLPPKVTLDLQMAAAAHDFSKKIERTVSSAQKAGGQTWDEYQRDVIDMGAQIMRDAGIPEEVILLSDCVAHTDFDRMNEILAKSYDDISNEEIAMLVMHWVDDVTVNDEVSGPARMEEGELKNSLDDRTLKNRNNEKIRNINEEGLRRYGMLTPDYQRILGHRIEERLTHLINRRKNGVLQIANPLDLAYTVDLEIGYRVVETSQE